MAGHNWRGAKHKRGLEPGTLFFIALALIVIGLAICRLGFFYAGLDVQFINEPK
jgi:hypothetical protein